MRSSARDWSLDRGRRRSGASKRRLPRSVWVFGVPLLDSQFLCFSRMSDLRLWHVRGGISNAGPYLDARTGRPPARITYPGAVRPPRLRTGRGSASFFPQQLNEFEMDARGLPTDAGGDAVETAQMRRPERQLRQGFAIVQLGLKPRHQSQLVGCRQDGAVDLQ